MGDPLSVTASIIAIATFGLQSTKLIYNTISGLSNTSKVFARTEQSLQSLNSVLIQIQELAQESLRPDELSTGSSIHSPEEFFKGLHTAVRVCANDLDPLAKKFGKWKASQKSRWPGKVASTLTVYIKSSDLREIDEILSKHLRILNVHLSIASCKQNIEAQIVHTASASSLSDQITQMSSALQTSATEASRHISTYNRDLEKNATTLQNHVRETIESTITSQFNKTQDSTQVLQDAIQELLCQLNRPKKSTPKYDLSEQLQDCIDRLYTINDKVQGDLKFDLEESQMVIEDIVTLLKALLDELSLPCESEIIRKRKYETIDDDEAAQAEIGIKQERAFKRMRSLLESSHGVQVRRSNWQKGRLPPVRRLESQNRVFETEIGSLAITTTLNGQNPMSREILYGDEEVTETFTGTLTLLPKTKERNMKIRAFFTQKKLASGSFSFLPTLSFHAVIPDDSKVFQIIKRGDLDGLCRMLQDRLASLTDCDTQGRSLLWYSLESFNGPRKSHIAKFLIAEGADVNNLERVNSFYRDMLAPPLIQISSGGANYDALEIEEFTKLSRLLLEAGADPTLCETSGIGYTGPFLLNVVNTMDIGILRMAIHDGGVLLDLEQQDISGQTALLKASHNSSDLGLELATHFVEISFEQVDFLLDHGASVLAKDIGGDTCLHCVFHAVDDFHKAIYRPRHLLTKLVARLIKAGADVFALDAVGISPSAAARHGGYERSWREALEKCGYSPQTVYANSGVQYEELEEVGVEDELIETLEHIRDDPPQWTPRTMQELLVQGIQSLTDLGSCLPDYGNNSISHLARYYGADREWAEALKTCGYDPDTIYAESIIDRIEPVDIIYDEIEEEDDMNRDEETSEDESMSYGDESIIEEEISLEDDTGNAQQDGEEEEQVSQSVYQGSPKKHENHHTIKEENCPQQAEMAQYVQPDSSTTNVADGQANNREIFIATNPNQYDEPEDSFKTSSLLGMDINMLSGNPWSNRQDMHLDYNHPHDHDNRRNNTTWMQDRASSSNSEVFLAEEWEPKASRTWLMDFGEEREVWMETNVWDGGELP